MSMPGGSFVADDVAVELPAAVVLSAEGALAMRMLAVGRVSVVAPDVGAGDGSGGVVPSAGGGAVASAGGAVATSPDAEASGAAPVIGGRRWGRGGVIAVAAAVSEFAVGFRSIGVSAVAGAAGFGLGFLGFFSSGSSAAGGVRTMGPASCAMAATTRRPASPRAAASVMRIMPLPHGLPPAPPPP